VRAGVGFLEGSVPIHPAGVIRRDQADVQPLEIMSPRIARIGLRFTF
jgi:hypothetical protein